MNRSDGPSLDGIAVLVPTYRPSDVLVEQVRTLASSLPTLVVDDGSPATSDPVVSALLGGPGVEVIRLPRNAGIATALETGRRALRRQGFAWILTLDQDSRLSLEDVSPLVELAACAQSASMPVGAVAPELIEGAGYSLRYDTVPHQGFAVAREVLQSGTLWSAAALEDIGGFRTDLVIDSVDTDVCCRLQQHGYLLVACPDAALQHSLGAARWVNVGPWRTLATGHRPFRYYYMSRNHWLTASSRLAVGPEFAVTTTRRLVSRQLTGLLDPGTRRATLAAIASGTLDALRRNAGALDPATRERWG